MELRFDAPTVLALATILIALLRAGIETQAGEAQALGFPWWTFAVAGVIYGLVAIYAIAAGWRAVVLVAVALPLLLAMFHLRDLRSGNATVWATALVSASAVVAQMWPR